MKYLLIKGLPESHSWKAITINGLRLRGIIWKEKDIVQNDTLFIYTKWPSIHFESDLYEIAVEPITNLSATRRDIITIRSILKEHLHESTALIDVNCGSGRHLFELARKGIYGIGMEGAKLLRNSAKKQARSLSVPIRIVSTSPYIRKRLRHRADIVTSLFNSIGYTFNIKDDVHRLCWMADLLKNNGYFLWDIRSYEYQKQHYVHPVTERVQLNIMNVTGYTTNKIYITTIKQWIDGVLIARETLTSKKLNSEIIIQDTTYGWNMYPLETIQSILKEAGLRYINHRMDYYSNKNNYGERMFILAQRH